LHECGVGYSNSQALNKTYVDALCEAVMVRVRSDLAQAESVVLVFDGYSHANGTKATGIVYRAITPDFRLVQYFLDLVETQSSQTGTAGLFFQSTLGVSDP
jgi:hypothetical protein